MALVLGLLLVWIFSESVRGGGHLAVLFFYSFPSEFLVGLVPHEPVLIHFGTLHSPWTVAAVAGVGTVLAESLNYSVFGYFYEKPTIRTVAHRPWVKRTMELFYRRPFAAVAFAAFTPVPFFPVRFLVVMTHYPRWRYLTAVALSRTPRFLLLAAFGSFFAIPSQLLLGLMAVMLVTVNVPAMASLLRGTGEAEGGPGS